MRKQLLWFGGLVLGLVALTLVVVVLIDRPSKPGVTVENFKRLHKGMTEEEVEAIFGRPADHKSYMTLQNLRDWDGPGFRVHLVFSLGEAHGFLVFLDNRTELEIQEKPYEFPLKQMGRWLGLK